LLVVAGNFDLDQFNAWVDQYFAPLTTPQREIPRVAAIEPQRAAARDFTVYEPNTPLPAIALSYRAPEATHADWSMNNRSPPKRSLITKPLSILESMSSAPSSAKARRLKQASRALTPNSPACATAP
jgi:hypothetical protein